MKLFVTHVYRVHLIAGPNAKEEMVRLFDLTYEPCRLSAFQTLTRKSSA